jgi:hypothetical protein
VVPALTAATLATPQPSGEQIAGIFSLKIGQQHVLPVAGQAGPVLLLTESQGTNRSTGPTRYMEGAQVISRELADLTQGNGAHQGYITEILGADTTVSRYQGKVVTILGADQKPQTSFEGTWSKVSGTGKYQGVSGAGRYKGRMTSQTEYTVEYTGEIVTPRTASR